MVKLFIFDLDGVIASTSEEHFTAWKKVIKDRFNIEIEDYIEEKTKGVSRMDSLNRILESYNISISEEEKIDLAKRKNDIYVSLISDFDESKLFKGIIGMLDFLKDNNVLIALGSASKNGPNLISSLGIKDYFDYVVDPGQLKSKPSPEIFLKAMNFFELRPNECIGVEDAISGVSAIKSAGMKAIGIGSSTLLKHADYIYENIIDINDSFLETLIKDK